ncbi:MAG TPA: SRPBCC family protein [Dehalococcoidia bacterium]|nr:SRPBCC family protein [Dehalococcoidia bacterium]
MFTAENTVTIDRPVGEVFAYAMDPLRIHEWRPNVLEIIDYEPPLRAGTEYQIAENMMGRKVFGQRVTEYQQDRLVVIETTSGSVRPVQRFSVEPLSEGSTRYTARLDITTHGFMRLMEPMFRGSVRKRMVEYGNNLKRNIEALPRVEADARPGGTQP